MSTLFVIAHQSSYDWDDIDKHINPIIKSRKDVHQILHWGATYSLHADNSAKAFHLLKTTEDPNHLFLLYKDYQNHPQIDEILHAVYDYKVKCGLSRTEFLDALVKTNRWVPKVPFPNPLGVVPLPEYERFFR